MRAVLDTHVWFWFVTADPRLGSQAKISIETALAGEGAGISAISPWEIAMLVAKTRLTLDRPVEIWLGEYAEPAGFAVVPLSIAISVESNRLPGAFHADPADRIIVATARHLGVAVVTADRKILEYAAAGHVKAVPAEI